MAARRCSTCSLNYPSVLGHQKCKVCGEATDVMQSAVIPPDWKVQVADAFYERRWPEVREQIEAQLAELDFEPEAS